MSTLKVNKLRDTAGSADAITLDPNGGAVLAGVTTVSTVKVGSGVTISSDGDVFTTGITTSSTVIVGSGVTISESGIEASGIGITCANINGTQIGGRRNLVINGDMRIAQRATSSTSNGYQTLDRYKMETSNITHNSTKSQQSLSSSDTGPYEEGFRYYARIALAQAGVVAANSGAEIQQRIEAQNIANSGWNYTSSSSDITLQFWFRCSTNQTFYGYLYSFDGTPQLYCFSFTASANNTWTKITKTIPGNSNLTFNNDNGPGLQLKLIAFYGTDYTNDLTLNQWGAFVNGNQMPDMASTWLTAGASTFDVTGIQLEVGSQATSFEHHTYQEEIQLCYRYYYKTQPGAGAYFGSGFWYNSSSFIFHVDFPVVMRTSVTALEQSGTAGNYKVIHNATTSTCSSVPTYLGDADNTSQSVNFHFSSAGTQGQGGLARSGGSAAYLAWDAEL